MAAEKAKERRKARAKARAQGGRRKEGWIEPGVKIISEVDATEERRLMVARAGTCTSNKQQLTNSKRYARLKVRAKERKEGPNLKGKRKLDRHYQKNPKKKQ